MPEKNYVVVVVPKGGDEAQGKHHAVDLFHKPEVGERIALDTGKSYEILRIVDDPAIQVVPVLYLDETTEEEFEAA